MKLFLTMLVVGLGLIGAVPAAAETVYAPGYGPSSTEVPESLGDTARADNSKSESERIKIPGWLTAVLLFILVGMFLVIVWPSLPRS